MEQTRLRTLSSLALGVALALPGCLHLIGPEDPVPAERPALVDVTVEYRQLGDCPAGSDCAPVVFYGSWMRAGGEFSLERAAATRVWRGTAVGVPVNFPPQGQPYSVYVFDPLLSEGSSRGITAMRLVVGGEILQAHLAEGTPTARALVYIDPDGHGRNSF